VLDVDRVILPPRVALLAEGLGRVIGCWAGGVRGLSLVANVPIIWGVFAQVDRW
jgi:hypothetical protein